MRGDDKAAEYKKNGNGKVREKEQCVGDVSVRERERRGTKGLRGSKKTPPLASTRKRKGAKELLRSGTLPKGILAGNDWGERKGRRTEPYAPRKSQLFFRLIIIRKS